LGGCNFEFSQGFPCSSTLQFNQVGLDLSEQIGQQCQFWHDDGLRLGRMVLTESLDGENLVQMTIELFAPTIGIELEWTYVDTLLLSMKNSSLFLITFPCTYLH
jgi:hypothetical protein